MGFVHMSVNSTSRVYLQNERRYNYTTPKSFLEQISLYSKLLRQKSSELTGKVVRLENGLDKLRSTAEQVKYSIWFSVTYCVKYNSCIFSVIYTKQLSDQWFIQNTSQLSCTEILRIMIFWARVTISSDNHTNPTCKLCVQNVVLFKFKGSAIYSHFCLYSSNLYIHFISPRVIFLQNLCCLPSTIQRKKQSFKITKQYVCVCVCVCKCSCACGNRLDILCFEVARMLIPFI